MEHDCFEDGCQYEGSLFCIWCGLTAEDLDTAEPDWFDDYEDDIYWSGTGELMDDESYIDYLNRY